MGRSEIREMAKFISTKANENLPDEAIVEPPPVDSTRTAISTSLSITAEIPSQVSRFLSGNAAIEIPDISGQTTAISATSTPAMIEYQGLTFGRECLFTIYVVEPAYYR